MLSSIAQSAGQFAAHNAGLLHRITSGHVLTIAPDSIGGLLLIKPFYVDFAGPGAAVGGEFDRDCTAVYQVGLVRLQTLLTQRDRQEAIQTRIAYAEQLAAILDIPHALQRSRLIVEQLTDWLPGNLSLTIPAELAAGLAGVLPKTIELAWQSPKLHPETLHPETLHPDTLRLETLRPETLLPDLSHYRNERELVLIPA
ncbi:MAG: hypothetical protein NW220_18795 [Leptolyngbyaceae cyanobacterium bins.349]|nr:hypothetical protein [Leptolyngbyaceae cyanobacterium bins.349]